MDRITVKVVNGKSITKMEGTKGQYRVDLTKTPYSSTFATFRTIKSAEEYIQKQMKK